MTNKLKKVEGSLCVTNKEGDKVAYQSLSSNFAYFFKRLNPSKTFINQAVSHHKTIIELIENPYGPARELSPICFLQGSYRQQTAIYTINDVDIVVLCSLWFPGPGGIGSKYWSRDEIFDTVAAPLLSDGRYASKVRYHSGSMCIKVDLGIKVEILPVVYQSGNNDSSKEPFFLYRQRTGQWEPGYARYHQAWLTWKNSDDKTNGNFIPAVKVFKHLRSRFELDSVSFHIECLLFSLPDYLFIGGPADYITNLLTHIASISDASWYSEVVKTPCGERDIFTEGEWRKNDWEEFHEHVCMCAYAAEKASLARNKDVAIETWQMILGENFFPKQVSK